MMHRLGVLVQTPAYSAISGPLTYLSEQILAPGTLVRVPLGKRETLGVVWHGGAAGATAEETTLQPALDPGKMRAIGGVLNGIAPLSANWRALVTFAANYYQRSPGEVALAALPPQLRDLDATQLARRLKRKPANSGASAGMPAKPQLPSAASLASSLASGFALSPEQLQALAQFEAHATSAAAASGVSAASSSILIYTLSKR